MATQYATINDLAHYMDDDEREDVHLAMAPCSAQAFWDEFQARYPASASDIRAMVRTYDTVDECLGLGDAVAL